MVIFNHVGLDSFIAFCFPLSPDHMKRPPVFRPIGQERRQGKAA